MYDYCYYYDQHKYIQIYSTLCVYVCMRVYRYRYKENHKQEAQTHNPRKTAHTGLTQPLPEF